VEDDICQLDKCKSEDKFFKKLMKKFHLFEAIGIELEYMIVDKDSLSVLPITDKIIHKIAQEYIGDLERGQMGWSNELALHVIELKTLDPVPSLYELPAKFHENIRDINNIAADFGGILMPTSMHPWMDPLKEMQLWPHDNSPIYEAYNRIFDCRGHGWSNLQSMHINLPFANDDEFGRLHAAIRMVLPIIPALAASSPIAERRVQKFLDYRLEVYRHNQSKIPGIAGKIIPEAIFTKDDYENDIFKPLYHDISKYDPEGILQEEWLNSRGAIPRWERYAIEIRLLDIQECPLADISIAALILETVKSLVNEEWCSYEEQKQFHEDDLSYILLNHIHHAENTLIDNPEFLNAFGLKKEKCTSQELWQHLFSRMAGNTEIKAWETPLDHILTKGTLSTRILNRLNGDTSDKSLKAVYKELCCCLQEDKLFD
jgi:glutamate---cysteine ligase / carboxylate-amine ligase